MFTTRHRKEDIKMAHVSIYLNHEVREEGKPLVDAMQLLADTIEGFFGYKLGDPDINEQNLKAMLWVVAPDHEEPGSAGKLLPARRP